MKRGVLKFTACCLAAGMTFVNNGSVALAGKDSTLAGLGMNVSAPQTITGVVMQLTETEAPQTEAATEAAEEMVQAEVQQTEAAAPEVVETEAPQTEPVVDYSMSGEMAFAQCDEYINVRSSANADSEVVGKVYNNGSVTILSQIGDWYEVQSGNAVGYVKADYFAIGEQAAAIAEEVAYNVATVYPEALVIRSQPSEDSESIGMAYSSDELEVVQYEGDWMKVALGNGVYGYVNAYYVGYDTYYATAETLEEEQARLDAEWIAYLEQQEAERIAAEQAYLEAIAAQQQTQVQQTVTSTPGSSNAQSAADQAYQEYLNAQAAADAATQGMDEQAVYDTAAAAQREYQEFLALQAIADQAAVDQANAAVQQQTAPQTQVQQTVTSTPGSSNAQSAADQAYQEYLNAQAAADAATQGMDEQAVYDTAEQAQAEYQEFLALQAIADQAAVDQANAAAQQQTQTEVPQQSQTEAPQTEAPQQPQTEAPQTEAPQQPASSTGQKIVNFATQFVGNPYVWGGTSLTNGADCSGFTQSVMRNFGISIPRTAASQSGSGRAVSLSEIQAGDLLFYKGGSGINHVTIYMGNGKVVHASSSTTGIIISDYGYRTPVSARRYW